MRPIGKFNCHHIAFPVTLGVSEPAHSETALADMARRNAEGITYEGKHFTGYEAVQMQHKIEQRIRNTKRELIVAENGGLKDDFTAASVRLRRLRAYYEDFSGKAGLITRSDLTQVPGYGRRLSGKALYAAKNAFTGGANGGIIRAKEGERVLRIPELAASRVTEKINAGEYSTALSHQQYLKHVEGTAQYQQYLQTRAEKGLPSQSILTITEAEAQQLILEKAGTGIIRTNRAGDMLPIETITADRVIGWTWSGGQRIDTTKAKIFYSKNGSHVVPIAFL